MNSLKKCKIYKIGDTVTIINKPPQKRNEGPSWAKSMDKYCGKRGVIITERISTPSCNVYKLDITGDMYWWDERWLQLFGYLEDELFEL